MPKNRLDRRIMIEVDNKKDLEEELKKAEQVLVLFYASWCPYCSSFVRAFDKTITNYGFASVVRVNLDDYDNPMWDDYDVCNVPTVIYFEEGKVCRRLDGKAGLGLSEKQFRVWLEQFNAL